MYNLSESLLLNESALAGSSLLDIHGLEYVLLISGLLLGLPIGVFVRMAFITYILIWAPKGRPINVMIGLDQTVALITVSTFTSLIAISLLTSRSIVDLFGPQACTAFVIVLNVNWMNSVVGGLSMVIYRFLSTFCHNFTHVMVGKFALMRLLVMIQSILVVIGIFLWQKSNESSGSVVAIEFCHNYDIRMAEIFNTYTMKTLGYSTSETGLWYKTLILAASLIVSLLELTLYAILFIDLYYHDKSMIKSLGLDQVRSRHRKNAVTMGGEALCFSLEFGINVIFSLVLNKFFGDSKRAFAPVALCFGANLRAIFQLQASPELKRHLKLM